MQIYAAAFNFIKPLDNEQTKSNSFSALIHALNNNHLQALDYLLQQKEKLTEEDKKQLVDDFKQSNLDFTKTSHTLSDIDWLLWFTLLHNLPDDTLTFLLTKGGNVNSSDDQGKDLISLIIMSGSVDRLKILLEKRADVNRVYYADGICYFPLKTAITCASNNEVQLVKTLVEYGANINQVDTENYNALSLAITQQKIEVLEYFLQFKEKFSRKEYLPLHLAIRRMNQDAHEHEQNLKIIQLLIRSGEDVNEPANQNETLLLYALVSSVLNLTVVEELLKAKADPNGVTPEGKSLLSQLDCRTEIGLNAAELLFKYGANPNNEYCLQTLKKFYAADPAWKFVKLLIEYGIFIPGDIRPQLLERAIKKGDETVTKILKQGEHLSAVSQNRPLALKHLLKKKISYNDEAKADIFKLLVRHKFEFTLKNSINGCDLLLWVAILLKSTQAASVLLQHGAVTYHKDNKGQTLLDLAMYIGHVDSIDLLLQATEHPAAKHMLAIYRNDARSLQNLLKNKIRFSSSDIQQIYTLLSRNGFEFASKNPASDLDLFLWFSILIKSTHAANVLIQHGANVHSKTNKGKNLMQMAMHVSHLDSIELLLKSTKSLYDFQPEDPKLTIVDYALRIISQDEKDKLRTVEIIELFIKYGAHINKKNPEGLTPLHSAILSDNPIPSIVQLLLEKGANPNENVLLLKDHPLLCLMSFEKLTPKDEEMADLLLEYGASPNQKTCDLLFEVIHTKSWKLTKLFLQYGLLPPCKLIPALTNLALAQQDGEILKLLKQYTEKKLADLKKTPGTQQIKMALETYPNHPKWELIERLLRYGVKPNREQSTILLQNFVNINDAKTVALLLQFDTDKQIDTYDYISQALLWGSIDSCKVLLDHKKQEPALLVKIIDNQLSQIETILAKSKASVPQNLFTFNRYTHHIDMLVKLMDWVSLTKNEEDNFVLRIANLEKRFSERFQKEREALENMNSSLSDSMQTLTLTPKNIPPKSSPIPIPKRKELTEKPLKQMTTSSSNDKEDLNI